MCEEFWVWFKAGCVLEVQAAAASAVS